jgi:hypothetical protein
MPFCPECRAEYRKGFDHCPSCDVDLVEEMELPEMLTDEEVIASMAEEDLVGIVRGSVEGCQETQAILLEQRIPAAIHESEDIVAEAGHFRILQVVVRKEDAERAQEALNQDWVDDAQREGLLRDVEFTDPDASDAEEDEGEADEDEQPACPACGCAKPLKKGKCRDCGLHLG